MCVNKEEVCMYKILYIGRPIESVVQVLKQSASMDLLGYILDKNLPEDKLIMIGKFFGHMICMNIILRILML